MRSFTSGIILAVPSVFPPIVIFGLMGWLGIVVDIGTVMTPSVALGVSVDDIVHFMLQYRRAVAAGADAARGREGRLPSLRTRCIKAGA